MGAHSKQILKIFMLQGLIIGSAGTLLGGVGGLMISDNLEVIVGWIERIVGVQFLPGDVYYMSGLPVRIDPIDVAVIIGVTLFISTVASMYPSLRAAQSDPIQGLRYD
jgi:lipoprotein-releasing system permease protein